jgi:heme A synthase
MAESEVILGPMPLRGGKVSSKVRGVNRQRLFRWLINAAVLATYVLIVFGGIVRVTDSGLGCPDWPLCYGQIMPPMNPATLIEYTHRLVTTAVAPLILGTAALAWRWYRGRRSILIPSLIAAVLLGVQIVLGGITVLTELHQGIVSVHLANAMLIFGLLITVSTQLSRAGAGAEMGDHASRGYRNLALATTAATFGLIVIGALVRGTGAGAVCRGFPGCGSALIPKNALGQLHMLHRLFAALITLLVAAVAIRTWQQYPRARALRTSAAFAVLAVTSQFAIGVAQVTIGLLPAFRALHLALATALWGSLVLHSVLASQAGSAGRVEGSQAALRGSAASASGVGD